MYGADAIIYAGHGGYETGNYNMNGGSATHPFALVGSNDFIWGYWKPDERRMERSTIYCTHKTETFR